MRDVGIGLIGSGFIAEAHFEGFSHVPAAAVRGVASPTPGNAARFAAKRGIPRHHTDYRALIEQPDVDVVCIGAPNDLHRDICVAAASAGKHVICEKPLATTRDDAAMLADLARRSAAVTAVPFVYRYYPTVREARARIAADEAGRLHFLHGSYLQDWLALVGDTNWRVDPAHGGASRAFG
ncbi:MAG TPA: Gfo/Idh/MocA family oxidoreductase, partial [Gaiellales bacterium]|nr:Gfo/Idh/MocA family oxidoreductase [Gaiellales bacterium]